MKHHSNLRTLFMLLLTGSVAGGEWTQFRGPNGSGVDPSGTYPVEFSPSKNLAWKAAVPFGQSSPIVAGGRVFLTASENTSLLTICLDARTGREMWRREIPRQHAAKIFRANDPASPTPAADDGAVYVFFPEFGLVSYSFEGKERWRQPLGPFQNFYGMATSPVVADDLVVLVCDQKAGSSFMLALDRATGRRRWRTERRGVDVGWATPMVYRPAHGQAELIVIGGASVDSYFLATGERRWWMPVGSMGALGTPVAHGETVLVSTVGTSQPWLPPFGDVLQKYDKDKDGRLSFAEFHDDKEVGEHFGWIDGNSDGFIDAQEWNTARSLGSGEFGAVALQPAGWRGQVAPGAVRWRYKKNLPYIPAPLVYGGIFYMVRTGGVITSLNAATGTLLKEGRSREALGEYYASPVAADGKVFLASEEGKISVLKAAGAWEVLAVNDIGDEVHATPALSDGRIYVRTHGSLYCFAAAR